MEPIRQNLSGYSLPWTGLGGGEQPKAVLHQGRLRAFVRCLVHIIPVVTTAGVVYLNFRNVYYANAGAPYQNVKLQALQFAAKLHEAFIVASLSTVVLNHIRYSLLSEDGVPFSVLSVGHLLGQFSQIWRLDLWTSLFVPRRPKRYPQQLQLALLVLAALFLAATCGPASAITMIPKLDWWQMIRENDSDKYYVATAVPQLWPNNPTAANLPSKNCSLPGGHLIQACPSGGYLTLLQYIEFGDSSGPKRANVTFQQDNTARSVASEQLLGGPDTALSAYRASSVSQLVADALWSYWNPARTGVDLNSISRDRISVSLMTKRTVPLVRKPQVEARCNLLGFQGGPGARLFLPALDANPNMTWEFDPLTLWNLTAFQASDAGVQFTWVNVSNSVRPSIGAAFLIPGYNLTMVDGSFFIDGKSIPTYAQPPIIVGCAVDARWVPVEMWLDPQSDNFAHQDSVFYDMTTNEAKSSPPPQIFIEPSWADALNIVPEGANTTLIRNLVRPISGDNGPLRPWPYRPQEAWSFMLSVLLTDALSRVTPPGGARLYNSSSLDRPAVDYVAQLSTGNWTQVRFDNFRYGYGYGLNGVLIKIAMVVLLAHASIALAHTITAVYGGWSSEAWGKVEELIALAINSSPSEGLQNTCAGIKSSETWGRMVRIRVRMHKEGVQPGHLEMVFDGEDIVEKDAVNESEIPLRGHTEYATVAGESAIARYERAQPGVAYGALPGLEDRRSKWNRE